MMPSRDTNRNLETGNNKNKQSLTSLVTDAGYGDFIAVSFEEAQRNQRRKNIVIIDDSEIYLSYKYNHVFGEFICWVADEFETDDTVYSAAIEWIKDIYSRTEKELDESILQNTLMTGFTTY